MGFILLYFKLPSHVIE